jgi:hypothetical protein
MATAASVALASRVRLARTPDEPCRSLFWVLSALFVFRFGPWFGGFVVRRSRPSASGRRRACGDARVEKRFVASLPDARFEALVGRRLNPRPACVSCRLRAAPLANRVDRLLYVTHALQARNCVNRLRPLTLTTRARGVPGQTNAFASDQREPVEIYEHLRERRYARTANPELEPRTEPRT